MTCHNDSLYHSFLKSDSEEREMLDNPQSKFITTELNLNLLSTPFGIQTNWHVITGAACSGKTTIIDRLSEKGYRTVPESGRQYINREIAKGRTIDDIYDSEADEYAMKDLQLRIEQGLSADELTFLDRALPDSLTYSRITGMNPNEILSECFLHRYASVFVFDRLPFQQNGIRSEEHAVGDFLDEWLARDYTALGYSVVRVPVLPPQERLAFVLQRLSKQELI
jgi:predicted ATPase